MAKCVAYTRVSTSAQSQHGASLGDQAERIERWLDENGHDLVARYSEHGSGGSAKNRAEFTRMMADLETLRPSVLICDDASRFTRNVNDGGKWVSHITDLGISLAVMDYDDGRLLDMRKHEDRAWLNTAFALADAERDRMSKRQLKRYAASRSRGATTVNRPPWGVHIEGEKRGYRFLVADADKVAVIREIDDRILAGQSVPKVLEWLMADFPDAALRKRTSLVRMLRDKSESYVKAGARSAETQAALREMFAQRRHIYGRDRKRPAEPDVAEAMLRELQGERPPMRYHALSGVIACGFCVRAGRIPNESLMVGYFANGKHALACIGQRGGEMIHRRFSIAVFRVIPLLYDKLIKLRDLRVQDAVLERWANEPVSPRMADQRESLERLLAACDEEEATIEAQVGAAFQLLTSAKAGVRAEAERLLERQNANRLALAARRAGLASRLADLPVTRKRRLVGIDRDELRINAEALLTGQQLNADGDRWVTVDVRDAFVKWTRLLGPPIIYRASDAFHAEPRLAWDYLDAVMPEAAPDFDRL